MSSFFPWQGQSEWGKGTKWVSRLGGAPPNTVRSVRGLVGSRLASSRLTARDGRGLTARGHNVMARELTPSYVSWAHSSSICGALLSLRVPVPAWGIRFMSTRFTKRRQHDSCSSSLIIRTWHGSRDIEIVQNKSSQIASQKINF